MARIQVMGIEEKKMDAWGGNENKNRLRGG